MGGGYREWFRWQSFCCALISTVATVGLTAAGCRAQTTRSSALPIHVSAATPVAGKSVTVAWTLKNTGNATLSGDIVYYVNGVLVETAPAINVDSVAPGKTRSGTYAFLPVPGWNSFVVKMNYTQTVIVFGSGKTELPKRMDNGAPAPTPTPHATHGVPVVTVVAQGSVDINGSPPVAGLASDLSAGQRQQLFKDYAPLLLYSFDHNSDEQYAPIDVQSFVKASALAGATVSNLSTTPLGVLDPSPPGHAGTLTTSQTALPAPLYLQPSDAARHGTDWATVTQLANSGQSLGLYGHAVLVDVANLNDGADNTMKGRLQARYRCKGATCQAQIIKIEYWQFYGFSHDYDGASLGPLGRAVQDFTDHDGDWCSVQLYVDASWWLSPRPDLAILAVYHYLHGNQVAFDMRSARGQRFVTVPARQTSSLGERYSAIEFSGPNYHQNVALSIKAKGVWLPPGGPTMAVEVAHAQNNVVQLASQNISPHNFPVESAANYRHPVVYVEWGGHEFWPAPNWSIFGASKHDGTGQYSYFGGAPVDLGADASDLDATAPAAVQLVRFFAGYWGTNGGSGPPPGPPLHREWYWDLRTSSPLANTIETIAPAPKRPF